MAVGGHQMGCDRLGLGSPRPFPEPGFLELLWGVIWSSHQFGRCCFSSLESHSFHTPTLNPDFLRRNSFLKEFIPIPASHELSFFNEKKCFGGRSINFLRTNLRTVFWKKCWFSLVSRNQHSTIISCLLGELIVKILPPSLTYIATEAAQRHSEAGNFKCFWGVV